MTDPLSERALQRLLSMAADDEAQAAPAALLPDRYEVVREIGRGGMGVVYECHDRALARRCAVKTIGVGAGADQELRRRFAREALAAARLRHPHIAAVYDATEDYISMQLVHGGPIDTTTRDRPHDVRAATAQIRDAARALQHAHEQGIVHRDIKPSNLLVENGHVFVVDFGLAKAIGQDASVSLAGGVVGTPAFMAPEQALGRAGVDARADVYGLGATLFACVRGHAPFAADDLPTLLRAVVDAEPPRLAIDRDLDVVVGKCLQKEPEHRYETAAALADDLDRWLEQRPILARPPSWRYRLRKRLQRQRTLWRAAAIAALVTALVLVPIALRAAAARSAATEAAELADHVAAVLEDALVYRRLGDTDSARAIGTEAIARVREYLERHDVPRVRYLLGRLLHANGDDDGALRELDRTIAQAEDLSDARFERGLLRAARLLDPDPASAAPILADLSVELGPRSALTRLERLFGRAELSRLRGETDRARDMLHELLAHDPTHVAARLSLAHIARAADEHDVARYYAASAVDFQQGFGPFYLAREQRTLPTRMLGLDGALVDFTPGLDEGFDHGFAMACRGLVHLRRALRLGREGALTAAREAAGNAASDYRITLQLHDDVAGAHVNSAVCHLVEADLAARDGDPDSAAAALDHAARELATAVRIDDASPEAHFDAGLVALHRGDASGAVAAFQRALARMPETWPHADRCRARLAEAQGR